MSAMLHATQSTSSDHSPSNQQSSTFAQVVRQSVQTALADENSRNDLVIGKVEEKGRDDETVAAVCEKIDFKGKPTEIRRLGQKKENRPRPLKVSFGCSFDARTFRASFEKRQKTEKDVPKWRLRRHRTKDEQELFVKNSKIAFRLNEDAKKQKLNESYSLRDDGNVWKFLKKDDGKWTREKNWRLSSDVTENSSSAPEN
jgi:hypothetical protein